MGGMDVKVGVLVSIGGTRVGAGIGDSGTRIGDTTRAGWESSEPQAIVANNNRVMERSVIIRFILGITVYLYATTL